MICACTGSGGTHALNALALRTASSRHMCPDDNAAVESPAATKIEERRIRRSAKINTAFRAIKAQHSANRSEMEILADRLIGVASGSGFLIVHAVLFVMWIFWNSAPVGLARFDPYPYGMLTTIVSLEAIFL